MSRKREKRRDRQRELARQLDGADAPDDLQARVRVTRVDLGFPSLEVESAPRKLLGRLPPPVLEVGLALSDPAGLRWVWRGRVEAEGPEKRGQGYDALVVRGGPVTQGDDERIRYSRPAHFVLVARRVEGDDELGDATKLRLVDGEEASDPIPLDGKALRNERWEAPRRVRVQSEAGETKGGPACAVVIRGVHRVKMEMALPLEDEERAWRLGVRLSL